MTNWNPDTIRSYGNALSTAGDVNEDGYDDIVYSVFFYNWYGYVFHGGDPMDTIPDMILECEGEGLPLMSICAGDINSDNVSDVIIGEGQAGNWGKVFIFFGGIGMDGVPDIILRGEPLNAWPFGISVACGDINGDSFSDLIVGSYDNGDLDGRVYVYYGGSLLDSIPDIVLHGHDGEAFGKSVGSGGDLNSDGYEDLVVGADENHEAYWGAGKIYVFFGGDPMDEVPDCWLHGEGVNHFLGWFGCDIMEVDNDYDMMITGTSMYPNGWPGHNPGKVYVLYGGDPMDTLPDLWMIGDYDICALGRRSRSAGDVNGDGYEDAVVGAPHRQNGLGTGYVWLGGMPMDTVVDAYLRGGFAPQQIGWEVASAGDVNGDGCDDMIFSNYAGADPAVWVCKYTGTTVTEQSEYGAVPAKFTICPNPFSKQTHISFGSEQSAASKVQLEIYDASGRLVRDFSKQLSVISHQSSVLWDGKDDVGGRVTAGIYFVRVETPDFVETEKVIHLK